MDQRKEGTKHMIYAMITGNAGNQFFQYAFARKLMLEKKDDLTVDMRYILSGDNVHKAENVLGYFNTCDFNLNLDGKYYPMQRFIYAMLIRFLPDRDSSNNVKRFEFLRKHSRFLSKHGLYFYDGADYLEFGDLNIRNKNLFVRGFWECDKYFDDIKDILVNELTPKEPPVKDNLLLYKKMEETESICVTVRRYDKEEVSDNFFSCDAQFFYNGVNYIKRFHPNATVFVFSDDVEWCRNNLDFGTDTYYESGNDPIWEKVRLMSSCKHFVISNSTFSWWVQYLSKNDKKIVVAPNEWRRGECVPIDIYQDSWIFLDSYGKETTHS